MTAPQDHTRFIVGCITMLAASAAFGGMWLLWKGFAGGGELVVTLNTAISGLVGFLGGRGTRPPPPTETTTTATANPDGSAVLTTETGSEKKKTNHMIKTTASDIILGITAGAILCYLSACAAFEVQTPYGNARSNGKSVKLVLPSK